MRLQVAPTAAAIDDADGPVIAAGKYSVWFRTQVGTGAGTVEFCSDGKLTGGDSTFSYTGDWSQGGKLFRASLNALRFVSGPPGVFGLDEVDIIITRQSNGAYVGFAKQAPGLNLEVELIPIDADGATLQE